MSQISDILHIPELISEQEITEHIARTKMRIKHVCEMYNKGFLTQDELYKNIAIIRKEAVFDFLDRNESNASYRIGVPIRRGFTLDSWSTFCKDYDNWLNGKEVNTSECRYLYYGYDNADLGIRKGDGVSSLDKIRFFQLINAFSMTADFFEPAPERCPMPNNYDFPSGTIECFTSVHFNCINDSGLASDALSAVGKKYALIEKNGLKANVEINSIVEEDCFLGKPDLGFIAFGTIEGYTSSREREIRIAVYNDSPEIHLVTLISDDDLKAFDEYPLWAQFRDFSKKKDRIYNANLQAIIDKAMTEFEQTT